MAATKRTTKLVLIERAHDAEAENCRLSLALADAVTGEYEATETCHGDGERLTFKLSRARAAHGGLITIISQIAGQRPTISAVYAEPYLTSGNVLRMPAWTWAALERLQLARHRRVQEG